MCDECTCTLPGWKTKADTLNDEGEGAEKENKTEKIIWYKVTFNYHGARSFLEWISGFLGGVREWNSGKLLNTERKVLANTLKNTIAILIIIIVIIDINVYIIVFIISIIKCCIKHRHFFLWETSFLLFFFAWNHSNQKFDMEKSKIDKLCALFYNILSFFFSWCYCLVKREASCEKQRRVSMVVKETSLMSLNCPVQIKNLQKYFSPITVIMTAWRFVENRRRKKKPVKVPQTIYSLSTFLLSVSLIFVENCFLWRNDNHERWQ